MRETRQDRPGKVERSTILVLRSLRSSGPVSGGGGELLSTPSPRREALPRLPQASEAVATAIRARHPSCRRPGATRGPPLRLQRPTEASGSAIRAPRSRAALGSVWVLASAHQWAVAWVPVLEWVQALASRIQVRASAPEWGPAFPRHQESRRGQEWALAAGLARALASAQGLASRIQAEASAPELVQGSARDRGSRRGRAWVLGKGLAPASASVQA